MDRLDLAGGDQTGRWMLEHPFPYGSGVVADRYARLSRDLARLLQGSSASARRAFWDRYAELLASLPERDRRYLGFQVWQEGVARYVELRTAEVAARRYHPTAEFEALPDYESLGAVAARWRGAILEELAHPDLARRQRVSFHAFGADLALLLDQDAPDWKRRYLDDKFFLERYLVPGG